MAEGLAPDALPPGVDRHSLGGQALVEGVMMRSPRWWAVAVRRPDGGIHVESHPVGDLARRHPWLDRPLLRGAIAVGEALSVGLRALAIASRRSSGSDAAPTRREVGMALGVAAAFFVGVFVVLPALVVPAGEQTVVRELIEGGLRIGLFLVYVLAISRVGEIRRLFAYHGAEHKVIAAVEAGAERSPAGVARFSTIHVRCGTNFLALVMIVAVAVFSVVGREPLWWRLASRVVLVPVVAAISYELLRWAARAPRNPLVRVLSWPGLALQRITTREPEPDQVEIALAAMDELLARHAEA